jgi:putative flippase GtrA
MPSVTVETVHSPPVPGAPTSLFGRAKAFRQNPEFWKVVRYVTVSGISTVFSLALLYIFYRQVGLTVRWANIVATAIATVPSYYLNRTWAWGRSGKSHFRREVLPFWIIAIISLALSTIAVQFAAHEADAHAHSKTIQTILVEAANFITYGVMWVGKFLLFNKILFVHRDGDDDGRPIVLVPVGSVDGVERAVLVPGEVAAPSE